MKTLLKEIEHEARRRDSRLVLLNLPDFWRLACETKLLGGGCDCGRHTCVAVPDSICTDTVRIMSTDSFDTHPLFLRGK